MASQFRWTSKSVLWYLQERAARTRVGPSSQHKQRFGSKTGCQKEKCSGIGPHPGMSSSLRTPSAANIAAVDCRASIVASIH